MSGFLPLTKPPLTTPSLDSRAYICAKHGKIHNEPQMIRLSQTALRCVAKPTWSEGCVAQNLPCTWGKEKSTVSHSVNYTLLTLQIEMTWGHSGYKPSLCSTRGAGFDFRESFWKEIFSVSAKSVLYRRFCTPVHCKSRYLTYPLHKYLPSIKS